MFKRVLFTLGLLSLFLLISCNNLIENYHGSNQLVFGIGNAANTVESAIRSNESINDDTELNVQCELLRGESVIDTQSVTKALKDLYSATFSLDNIPNGNNYYISIKISYNNTVIYDALSDVIILGEGQEEANVSLQLKQKNSSITFDLCGGSFKESVTLPSSYFINSSIVLPIPEKAHNQFDGWYLSKDFSPEKKVEALGKTCFLGDVTLYAQWTEIIDTVVITPSDGNIDYGEKIKLTAGKGANIYYTLDGTDPTEKSTIFKDDIVFDDNIIQNDKVTVKAIAVKEGMVDSDVVTKEYTLKRYNVTFNHNGHGILPPNANKTGVKKGDPIASPGDLTESGYTFDGWYGTSDFKGSVFDFDTTKVQTASVDIYAKWTPITYNITYENCATGSDGISIDNSKNTTTSYNIESPTITLQSPVKSGFSFDGWYTENNGGGSKVEQIATGSTEDKTLYAKWTDVAPGAVKNLTATTENGAITLSWTNPDDADIDKVFITCDDKSITINPVSVAGESGQSSSCKIPCANRKVYNFELKVADKADHGALESDVQTLSQRLYVLTESPVVLTDYTSAKNPTIGVPTGSNGEWQYVEFGDWPQTLKADSVTVSASPVDVNNWLCYYGSDGYYYIKEKANPYESGYIFADGTTVGSGKDYYFKLEPIKWRVLTDNYNGNKLLLAEKALAVHRYHSGSSKYDTSEIRELLNGKSNVGFLQKAFTQAAINKIENTTVDNSEQSTFGRGETTSTNNNVCGNTTDKIFLLSVKEVTTAEYGFDAYDANDTARQRKPTDYAKATGIYIDSTYSTCSCWLRSPDDNSGGHVRDVYYDGCVKTDHNVYDTYRGIVPALSILF